MKRSLLLGAVSALALIAPAQAADTGTASTKETEAAEPLYNFAGFYAGVNGGGAWNEGSVSVTGTQYDWSGCWEGCGHTQVVDGGFGGGQIGFNVQQGQLVYGLEADIQGAGLTGSARAVPYSPEYGSINGSSDLDWFGTVRGRVGIVYFSNWLFFTSFGLAYGGIQDNLNQSFNWGKNSLSVNRDDVYAGYVFTSGVEYGWSPQWSVKLEGEFMDLGDTTLRLSDKYGCNTSELTSFHSFSTILVGINYHFVPEFAPLK